MPCAPWCTVPSRSRLAPSVKIIVRETSGKLRAHSEQALLHLWVTAVAYRELGFARLLRMIASARTLVHTQPVQGTMEQVLGAFAPAHVRGYQAPAAFEQAARQVLQRSRAVRRSILWCICSCCPELPMWTHSKPVAFCAMCDRHRRCPGVAALFIRLYAFGCALRPEQYVCPAAGAIVCGANGR